MIGTIAGDVIGSPYVNNPRKDSSDIFFPLFASSEKVELDGVRARMHTYQAKPGELSRDVAAVTAWMMRGERTKDGWEEVAEGRGASARMGMGSVLAACVPVVRLSDGADDALRNVSVLVAAARPASGRAEDMKAAMDYARLVFAVLDAGSLEDALKASRKALEEAGYDLSRNTSVLSPFLQGTVVELSPGRLGPGDGKPVKTRFLLIEGWQTLHDFVRTRVDPSFGFYSTPAEMPHLELVVVEGGAVDKILLFRPGKQTGGLQRVLLGKHRPSEGVGKGIGDAPEGHRTVGDAKFVVHGGTR